MAYLTSYFSGDINETHGLPLNITPVTPPHIYQSILRDYRISESHGDYRVSLLGREGFKVCPEGRIFHRAWPEESNRPENCNEEGIGSEFDFMDVCDIGCTRYYLIHNKDKTRGYVGTSCMDCCGDCKKTIEGCCGGPIRLSQQFDITSCTDNKFEKLLMPRGFPEQANFNVRNVLIGNNIIGMLCPPTGTGGIEVSRKFLNCFITLDVCGEEGYSGQTKEIVSIMDGCYVMDTPWQGLNIDLDLFTLQDQALNITANGINSSQDFIDYVNSVNENQTEIAQEVEDVIGSIYCDYGEAVVFATSDGIKYVIANACDDVIDVQADCSDTFVACFGNTKGAGDIVSMFNYDGQFGYLNSRGYVFMSNLGINTGYFTSNSTVRTGEDYNLAVPFGGIVMLFSKERMGYIYRTGSDVNGLPDVGYEFLGEVGYMNRCAVDTYLGNLYIIGSDKELYAVNIQYTGDGVFGNVRYRPQLNNISRYIRDRIKAVDICKGDKICLNVDSNHIRLFIGNDAGRVINGEFVSNNGTIILNFERYEGHQFWHMRTVCNERICGQHKECFYGDSIYYQDGCLDGVLEVPLVEGDTEINGVPFKQCVGMHIIDNPAGGTNTGIFSELMYKQLALVLGDQHMEGSNSKVKTMEFGYIEDTGEVTIESDEIIEYEGRTSIRTRTTYCGKEEVESAVLGDECFFNDLDKQLYKQAIDPVDVNVGDILKASEETMLEDVFNIGRSNKDREFLYCDIEDLCGTEEIYCKIETCFTENDCECKDLAKEFDTSKYWRYARRGILTKSINKVGNHMYFEISCDGGDRLHLVAMGVEIDDNILGFGQCDCNTISKIPKMLNEVCKKKINENTSAKA